MRNAEIGANIKSVIALNAVTGAERWRKSIEDGNEVYKAAMVYANVTVYASTQGGMYALDALSGAEQWRYTSSVWGERWIRSTPKISGGIIYLGSARGHLYAFNANTGVEEWKYKRTNGGLYNDSSTMSNGRIYIATEGPSSLI